MIVEPKQIVKLDGCLSWGSSKTRKIGARETAVRVRVRLPTSFNSLNWIGRASRKAWTVSGAQLVLEKLHFNQKLRIGFHFNVAYLGTRCHPSKL